MELSADTALLLWDGRSYCERCVSDAWPGAIEFARTHVALEDRLGVESVRQGWRFVRNAVVSSFLGSAAFVPILPIAEVILGIGIADVLAVTLGTLFGTGFWVSIAATKKWAFPRIVHIEDGLVSVSSPSGRQVCALADCTWFRGRVRHDRNGFRLTDGPAIIIQRPGRLREACARDPESCAIWAGFLSLAGVSRTKDRTGRVDLF